MFFSHQKMFFCRLKTHKYSEDLTTNPEKLHKLHNDWPFLFERMHVVYIQAVKNLVKTIHWYEYRAKKMVLVKNYTHIKLETSESRWDYLV